jgi:hypothetical protein
MVVLASGSGNSAGAASLSDASTLQLVFTYVNL